MRFNDKELRLYIKVVRPQLEGKLSYSDRREGQKDRKVCLVNSLLLMYRISPNGAYTDMEPTEFIVLTNCTVRQGIPKSFAFQIVVPGIPFESIYTFQCKNAPEQAQWITALRTVSATGLQRDLELLRKQVSQKREMLKEKSDPFKMPTRPAPPVPQTPLITQAPLEPQAFPAPKVPPRAALVTQSPFDPHSAFLPQSSPITQTPLVHQPPLVHRATPGPQDPFQDLLLTQSPFDPFSAFVPQSSPISQTSLIPQPPLVQIPKASPAPLVPQRPKTAVSDDSLLIDFS